MSTENPYQPPQSPLGDPHQGDLRPGGTLEGGLAGDYQIRIGEMLSEAWNLTKGTKGSYWAALVVIVIISIIVGLVFDFIGVMLVGSADAWEANIPAQVVSSSLQGIVLAPFTAGIIMMGIKRAAGLNMSFDTAFGYLGMYLPFVLLALLETVFTSIGYMLLVLPGIYLAIAYTLAVPLMGDRKLTAMQSLEISRKAVTRQWFMVFVLLIVMSLIMVLGVLSIIGWIWTMPMFFNLIGILYRDVFGVQEAGADGGASREPAGGMHA